MSLVKKILPLILVLALFSGCSLIDQGKQDKKGQSAKPIARYYDFDDVQVPSGMTFIQDRSMIFRVGSFKAGVLTFQDRVESASLINFFMASMAKDNWVLKGSFKSSTSALFFAKQGKTCVIQVSEGSIETTLQIWVSPSL